MARGSTFNLEDEDMPAMIGERPMTTAEIQRRYKDRHPERMAARNKAYAQANPEIYRKAARESMRRRRIRDPEKVKEYNKKYRAAHLKEHSERERRRYIEQNDKVRSSVLKQKFGITLEQYNEMLSAQNGVCAICSSACKSGRRLAVDHCHSTGKVRGLLCGNCNNALGRVNDSPEILHRMIKYLE